MFIIVEGMKCSGKTTVAKKLSDILEMKYFNERGETICFNNLAKGETRNLVAKYCTYLELEFAKLFDYCVDRFHISEHVYRKINFETIDYFEDIESKIMEIPHLLLFCCPNYESLLNKTIERDGIDATKNLRITYNMFLNFYKRSKLNKRKIKTYEN